MSKVKFYICEHCGNIITKIQDKKVPVMCCGQKMTELVPNTVEASGEKHIPVAEVQDGLVKVNVGSVDHPMVAEHFIEWVYLETDKGGQIQYLNPESAPMVVFALNGEKPVAVFAYCNLHGLWRTDL